MKRMLILTAVALGLALSSFLAPVSQAAPIEREHYSGTETFHFDDCGFVVHVEATFDGVFMLKAPRRGEGPPYYFDNYEVHQTLTANDRTLFMDHQGLYKDLRITHVEGTVYQFVAMEAGQPFVMRGEDDEVILRDRGLLRVTFQVDTRGDLDLDNDVFVEDSFSLLADNGRHPGFYIDFCEVITDYFFG